jgi:hypothetical protein
VGRSRYRRDGLNLSSSSAQAPVNAMPVAHQREHQEQKRNQEQTSSLRRVNRVATMLVIVLRSGIGHVDIVAPSGNGGPCRQLLAR